MTREIAIQYARQIIRANALCPGPVDTGMVDRLFDSPQSFERRRIHMPLGRLGRMSEVAAVALFLASDESSYVTGAAYLAEGIITAAYVTPEQQSTRQHRAPRCARPPHPEQPPMKANLDFDTLRDAVWTHPGKVEAPYTVCIASASNLTGLVKSSVECRRTGL